MHKSFSPLLGFGETIVVPDFVACGLGGCKAGFIYSATGATQCTCLAKYNELKKFIACLEAAHVPSAYWNSTFQTFNQLTPVHAAAVGVISKYLQGIDAMASEGYGLCIRGPALSGKTHLAIAILREVMAHRPLLKPLFVRAADVIDLIFSGHKTGDRASLEELHTCPFLVLDGVRKNLFITTSGHEPRRLEAIAIFLEKRNGNGYPTIVTTDAVTDQDMSYSLGEIHPQLYKMAIVQLDGNYYEQAQAMITRRLNG
jgi:chromosomal replication initiation ATPase DnaA